MSHLTATRATSPLIKYILVTGIIAGILDAVAAILVYQANPASMFKFIASGAFGKSAFSSGDTMIVFGVIFHFIIAISWTALFFLMYPKLKLRRVNILLLMILYGIVIWCGMNLVVLRFSQIQQGPISLVPALKGIAILIIAVAAPVVASAKRFYP